MAAARILVGTASWSDPEFVRDWYPKKMPARERLTWYAQQFEMVEVNSSFYSVPDARMVARWCATTPENFVFNCKLHQLLSRHSTPVKMLPPHLQESAEVDAKGRVTLTAELEAQVADATLPALEMLSRAGKLGVLLLQLSPAFSPRQHDVRELAPLLKRLQPHRVAIEFRNRNWTVPEHFDPVRQFFAEHQAAYVNVDAPRVEHFTIMPSDIDEVWPSGIAYLRLHGRDAKAYTTGKTVAARFNYDYSNAEIEEIAKRSRSLAENASQTHIVFNNNASDYAPHAAARLRKALGQIVAAPARTAELF